MRIEFPRDHIRIVCDLTPPGWRRGPDGAPMPPSSVAYSAQALGRAVEALLMDGPASAHRFVITAQEFVVEVTFPVEDAPIVEVLAAERRRLAAIVEQARHPRNGERSALAEAAP